MEYDPDSNLKVEFTLVAVKEKTTKISVKYDLDEIVMENPQLLLVGRAAYVKWILTCDNFVPCSDRHKIQQGLIGSIGSIDIITDAYWRETTIMGTDTIAAIKYGITTLYRVTVDPSLYQRK